MAEATKVKDEFRTRAAADFAMARGGLEHALRHVPADRLNWSPSPSARTPLEIAGHAAKAVRNMLGNMTGETFAVPTPDAAEQLFREEDKGYRDLQTVLTMLQENGDAYLNWLDAVTDEHLERVVPMPFGLPSMRVRDTVAFMALHMNMHVAQIQYIQTIYGDRDWHLGE